MPKPLRHRIGQVRALALSSTARNSGILFGGNFLNAVLGMVAVIFVSRSLGPAGFGVLAVYNAVNTVLIGLTNFGLDTAAIKLISSHADTDRRHAAIVMKAVFMMEMLSGVIIIVAGLFLSDIIARSLGGEHLVFAIRLAFLASAFQSAAAFVGPFFIAYQRFVANALVGLIGGVMRVGLVLALVATIGLNLDNVLWVYTLIPITFFFAGLALAPKDWRITTTREEDKAAWKEVFHFSKWILLSYLATVIVGRLDVFMISSTRSAAEVGLYAAAIQLCSVMPLVIGAITTVLLPQVSRYKTRTEFKSYLKKVTFGGLALCLLLLPIILWGEWIIELIFGGKYNGSFDAFRIMFAGYLVALIANPISLVMYGTNKPALLTIVNYVQLVVAVILNFTLIPMIGINGAALSFLAVNTIGGIASIGVALRAVKKVPLA